MPFAASRPIVRSMILVPIMASLCSCANDPFRPLADALLRPKDERQSAARADGTPRVQRTEQDADSCGRINSVVQTDVDTAYARVMSRLRFRTLDERTRFAEQYSSGMLDEGFRHTAQPGAYYRLADLVGWSGTNGAREAAWLDVELSRDGATRTRFVGKYCLSSTDPRYADGPFRASLERRLRDSVK